LVEKGWVTRQQGDVDLQNLKAQEAAVAAAKHNVTAQENLVKQLYQGRDYASVVAPFDGVITQRKRHLHVRNYAAGRHPRLGLRAAGRGLRRGAGD
jgi:multidrug efflux pump subunit AcrA (membrane-fusion protein)